MKNFLISVVVIFFILFLGSCDLIDNTETSTYYQISFETNGGSKINAVSVETEDFNIDDYVTTKEGYRFDGWYDSKELSNLFDESLVSDVTLYARWVKTYTISFENLDGTLLQSYQVDEGTMPVFDEIPTYDSYTFDGWHTEIVEATEDATYRATYIQTVDITFETNGGTLIDTITVNAETFTISDLNNYITTKEGYQFDWWYLSESLDERFLGELESNMTLYAKWDQLYTITWKNQDGSVLETDEVVSGEMPVYDGDTPVLEGELFNGWSEDVVVATSDKTYTAVFVDPSETSVLTGMQTITEFESETNGFGGLPSTGTYDVLVIPIEIKDYPFDNDYLLNIDTAFNGTEEETGWESVSSYYQQSSFGKLNLTFNVVTKYTTDYNASYYQQHDTDGDQYAIREAMNDLDSSIDYSHYDTNGDGAIDAVIFVYSRPYDGDIDLWWAWVYDAEYGVADSVENVDGVDLEYYMWVSYTYMHDNNLTGVTINAETYIHEMGHLMGFPDLYSSTHYYDPVGGWDMMSFNTGDHGPLNKLLYGWLEPTILTQGTYLLDIESYALDEDGRDSVLLIPFNENGFNDGDAFDEYLLIMYYTPEGLYEGHLDSDLGIDEAGVLVYHVEASVIEGYYYWGTAFNYNNEGDDDLFVEILEADFNDSLPSDFTHIQAKDFLTSGTMDLSYYEWQNGDEIEATIEVISEVSNDESSVILSIIVE